MSAERPARVPSDATTAPATLHLACATDDGYAPHAAAMLHSIVEHSAAPVAIHVPHGRELAARSRERVRSSSSASAVPFASLPVDDAAVAGCQWTTASRPRCGNALNLVLRPRRLALRPGWNCMNAVLRLPASEAAFGAEAVAEVRSHPGIRHFEMPGANKPWDPRCDWPMRELCWRHRAQTPWPKRRLEELDPAAAPAAPPEVIPAAASVAPGSGEGRERGHRLAYIIRALPERRGR